MSNGKDTQIRILDSASIDRIAAGEVIERPASVVKELIENALDAGAGAISISLSDGGMASIIVEDDGRGIPGRQLPLAFERHATSKIGSAADIVQVATFGFRGEALASIASVSRCTLISRVAEEDVGNLLRIAGSKTERREPAARNRGTTVQVEDLFYNTPARRKYAKTAAAETKAVIRVVETIGMANPDIRWTLKDEGRQVLDYLPTDSLPSRARDILGVAAVEHMARFYKELGGLSIGGLASRPTYTRPNRTQQFIYINKRPIQSQSISMAIQTAFRDVIPPGRHPAVILFLQLPPGEVDVNVHPAKTEVRLMLERSIFGAVSSTLQEGLDLRSAPSYRVQTNEAEIRELTANGNDQRLASIARAQEEFLRSHASGSGGPADGAQPDLFSAPRNTPQEMPGGAPFSSADPGAQISELRQAPFWQLHKTFICTQTRGGLVIIDQHNSHERILYNEARKAMEEGRIRVPIQQLLFPVNLELTATQLQAFNENASSLGKLGFAVEPFGGKAIIVQGIPSSLRNWRDGELLLDILDDLSEKGSAANADQDDLLASYACHGAVRAGAVMTVPEMQNLVDKLFATDLPLSCPHGRPTLIQFTIEELEKRFGRR